VSGKFVSQRNLKFLLYEVMDAEDLTSLAAYQDHDRESMDLMLETAFRLGDNLLFPAFREMDLNPPEYVDGGVRVSPVVREFMGQCGAGGWVGATFSYDDGGMQLPSLVNTACLYVFGAANFPGGRAPWP
jgi:alkylation response protein AidB-like acyl-CoA dehydrogenase